MTLAGEGKSKLSPADVMLPSRLSAMGLNTFDLCQAQFADG